MSPRSARSNRFRSSAPNTRALTLNWSTFMESVVEDEEMMDNNDIKVNFIEDSDSTEWTLWKEVKQNKKFPAATNFTEYELLDIWYEMQPHIEEQKTRGPKCQILMAV